MKRTHPQIPMVLSPDQTPYRVEQITDSGTGSHESLSLDRVN
jgi:hypothetical protein